MPPTTSAASSATDASAQSPAPKSSADPQDAVFVRIAPDPPAGATPLLSPCGPLGAHAWLLPGPGADGDLLVKINAQRSAPSEPEPRLSLKLRDAEVGWSLTSAGPRASIKAAPEVARVLLPGVAEFTWIESELRQLERETAACWSDLHQDRLLAFEATTADLRRNRVLADRMNAVLDRRIRLARLEPHLLAPPTHLASPACRLAEKLREEADLESRLEVLDGQFEVFEHIYEMGSQRLGEFRASHQGNRVEWIIVALLAVETLLMLLATFLQRA